jgi:hypothetical protein
MSETCEILLELLQDQVGKENAVKSKQLEILFSMKGATIRGLINTLRRHGNPICSGREGYWFASSIEEVEKTKEHLQGRMFGLKGALKGLEMYVSQQREKELREMVKNRQLELTDYGII